MSNWSTEELFFPAHEMGGALWENREGYARWDPAAFVGNWATPQLVIHSELDYRLPISEGLAAFNGTFNPDITYWVMYYVFTAV